jgi:hypothetical protein
VTFRLIMAIATGSRGGDDQEHDVIIAFIPGLMRRARRDLNAMMRQNIINPTVLLHRQRPEQDVEELAGLSVVVAYFGAAWRHSLLNDEKLVRLNERPSIGVASPGVVVGAVLANDHAFPQARFLKKKPESEANPAYTEVLVI